MVRSLWPAKVRRSLRGNREPGILIGASLTSPDTLAGTTSGGPSPDWGIVYPSNLTPDKETGIWTWSKADIIKLLRTGVTPDGREVAPMMPRRSHRVGSDADLDALAEFPMSLPAVRQEVPGPTKLEHVKTLYVTVTEPPAK